jgi:imidazolonepropionase-like amidohydrolase
LGLQGDVGTVEAGKYADLVTVEGDPLADIHLLQKMLVMKSGKVFRDQTGPEIQK